jgi:hypothetical protein
MTLLVDLPLHPLMDRVGIIESIAAVIVATQQVLVVLVVMMMMEAIRMMLTVTLANKATIPTIVTLHGCLLIAMALIITPVIAQLIVVAGH